MNEKPPFPKPPPADPLPLNLWLDDTDRAEVGREPFFRGRDKEYRVFQKAANMLDAGRVGGGTMIFQGAPGAGKTALMQECMEAVRLHSTPDQPWVAASINPATLQITGGSHKVTHRGHESGKGQTCQNSPSKYCIKA